VPEHANRLGWTLGGLTAASLVVLVVTGIVLTQFFNPIPEEANLSVRRIVTDVPLGGFVRGVHFWAAQAMYVLAGLHLLRVFLTGSYKRPREANWLIGVTMFALVIAAIFTGTVIKWDQEGFEALVHNLEVARLLGGLGFWLSAEFAAELPLNVRLYVAHIAVIPGLIVGLLAVHFLLVKRHGISAHPTIPRTGEPAAPFSRHLSRNVRAGAARRPGCPGRALPRSWSDPRGGHRGHPAAVDVLVAVHAGELGGHPRHPVGHRGPVRDPRRGSVRRPRARAVLSPPAAGDDPRRARAPRHVRAYAHHCVHPCSGAHRMRRMTVTFWLLVATAVGSTGGLSRAVAAEPSPATSLGVALSGLVLVAAILLLLRILWRLDQR
jgi:hypothetical protein